MKTKQIKRLGYKPGMVSLDEKPIRECEPEDEGRVYVFDSNNNIALYRFLLNDNTGRERIKQVIHDLRNAVIEQQKTPCPLSIQFENFEPSEEEIYEWYKINDCYYRTIVSLVKTFVKQNQLSRELEDGIAVLAVQYEEIIDSLHSLLD